MKALVLTDDEFDMVQAACSNLAVEYQNDLDDGYNEDEAGHRWSVEDVRRVANYRGVQLGGLDGVIITFDDGPDDDTWGSLLGFLEGGYCVTIVRTDGEQIDGYVTDVNDPEAGFVQDEHEPGEGGVLHGTPVSEVAGVHIY